MSEGRGGSAWRGQVNGPLEEIVVLLVGLAVVAALVRRSDEVWVRAGVWATEHGVLVAGSGDPLLVIPGLGGAGLDVPRLAIAGAVVAAGVAVVVGGVARRSGRGRDEDRVGRRGGWRR